MIVTERPEREGCKLCHEPHRSAFKKLPVKNRIAIIKEAQLCQRCLLKHDPDACKFSVCPYCDKDHKSMLCYKREKDHLKRIEDKQSNSQPIVANVTASVSTQTIDLKPPEEPKLQVNILDSTVSADMRTVLGTATATVMNANPWNNSIRALCDTGAQVNLITKKAVKRLELLAEIATAHLSGVKDSDLGKTSAKVTIRIAIPNSD